MHHTHNLDALAAALLDLVGALNSPRQDDILLRDAGVLLDRALFPLLVRIAAAGTMSAAALADRMGRDHSTISRQISKLEALALIERHAGDEDQRIRAVQITGTGQQMIQAITKARRRLLNALLADWTQQDCADLARLNQKLANGMKAAQRSHSVLGRRHQLPANPRT